nr:hypothetical protein JVH1_2644 [Rhodococcus sp. JVH1]
MRRRRRLAMAGTAEVARRGATRRRALRLVKPTEAASFVSCLQASRPLRGSPM